MTPASTVARPFRRGFVVGVVLVVGCVVLLAALAGLAPNVFRQVEALGDYQLKPWIFAAPLPIELVAVLAFVPGLRERSAWLGILAGLFGTLSIGVALGYAVVLGVVGSVHY